MDIDSEAMGYVDMLDEQTRQQRRPLSVVPVLDDPSNGDDNVARQGAGDP